MSHINFNILSSNVNGMQTSKKTDVNLEKQKTSMNLVITSFGFKL